MLSVRCSELLSFLVSNTRFIFGVYLMRRIKSCGLFVLSLTVLSTGLSVLLSVPSSAASVFDNAYQTVNTLQLWNGTENVNVSNTWAGYFTDSQNYPNAWKGHRPDTKDKYLTSWQNRQRWSVVQQCLGGTPDKCYYTVFWTESDDFYLEWSSDPLMVTGRSSTWVNALAVEWNNDLKEFRVRSHQLNDNKTAQISYPAANVKNFIAYTDFPNYPVNYAGSDVVTTQVEKVSYAPRVTISVEDKHISGNICMDKSSSICGIPPGFGQELSVTYKIYPKVDPTKKLLEQGGSLVSGQMTFSLDVADYSDYVLEARFYLPIPFVEPDDVEFKPLRLPIKVDGSSYMSSSVKQKCVIGGECEEPSVLRDCSVYDMADITQINKLGPLLSCHLDNYGLRLNSFFREYFVLDGVLVKFKFNEAVELVKKSLGVLWSPLEFILRIFGLITDQGVNPVGDNCYLGNFTLFGGTAPIYLCQWRQQLPQLFSIMQVVMRAGIAIGLFFMFWGKLHELMGIRIPDFDDDDDEYGDLSGARWYDDRTGESGSISDGSIGRRGGSR